MRLSRPLIGVDPLEEKFGRMAPYGLTSATNNPFTDSVPAGTFPSGFRTTTSTTCAVAVAVAETGLIGFASATA